MKIAYTWGKKMRKKLFMALHSGGLSFPLHILGVGGEGEKQQM